MSRHGRLTAVILGAALLAAAHAQERGGLPRPGDWLVDHARDLALRMQGAAGPAGTQRVRITLEAAARLAPDHFEAWRWLHELAVFAGDRAAAEAALERLRTLRPDHEHIFALWLEQNLGRRNTLEERQRWLGSLFDHERHPRNLSLIHAELARYALQTADVSLAQRYLVESRELCPECPEAPLLAVELLGDDTPPVGHLDVLLDALRADPLSPDLFFRTGMVLDRLGLPAEAADFYTAGRGLVDARPGTLLAPVYALAAAGNALARGDIAHATQLGELAVRNDRSSYESAFWMAQFWRMLAKPTQAAQIIAPLKQHFGRIEDLQRASAALLAQAAWFYTVIDPNPQRALLLAEAARQRSPGQLYVQRSWGAALAANDRSDEAIAILAPLARQDPEAAFILAKVYQERAAEGELQAVLRDLDSVPIAGPTRVRLAGFGLPLPGATAEERQAAAERLTRFDRSVLDFYRQPQRFVAVRVKPLALSPRPGAPWPVEFAVRNIGEIPLTLGVGSMVQPTFVVSLTLDGDEQRAYPHLYTITLDARRVLAPGETVQAEHTLNVGPPWRAARRTPQRLQRVVLDPLFDPERTGDGAWRASATGQRLQPVSFNRLPATPTPELWNAYLSYLSGDEVARRLETIAVFADLLGEHQRQALGRLDYDLQPIPADTVRRALLAALDGGAWGARATALLGLREVGLDADMLRLVDSCLSDEHWLVRLLAVELVGEREIAELRERLERVAESDADELVRRFARTYVGNP